MADHTQVADTGVDGLPPPNFNMGDGLLLWDAEQVRQAQREAVAADRQARAPAPPAAAPAGNMTRLDVVMLALRNARDTAMRQMVEARVPECAQFSQIAQNLAWVVGELEQAEVARQEQMRIAGAAREGGNTNDESSRAELASRGAKNGR